MITFYLIFLLCINEVLERAKLKNGQLYLQILASLGASILLVLPEISFDIMNLKAVKANGYLVTGVLIIFGSLKLFEIIATGKKKIEKIQLPLFVLIILSQSNISISLLMLILFFLINIKKNINVVEIEKISTLILLVSGFAVSISNIGFYGVFCFYLIITFLFLLASNPVMSLISINLLNLSFLGPDNHQYLSGLVTVVVWIGFIVLYYGKNNPNFLNGKIYKVNFYYKARSQRKNNFFQVNIL